MAFEWNISGRNSFFWFTSGVYYSYAPNAAGVTPAHSYNVWHVLRDDKASPTHVMSKIKIDDIITWNTFL